MLKKFINKIHKLKEVPLGTPVANRIKSGKITKEEAMLEMARHYGLVLYIYKNDCYISKDYIISHNNMKNNILECIDDVVEQREDESSLAISRTLIKMHSQHKEKAIESMTERNMLLGASFQTLRDNLEECQRTFPEDADFYTTKNCIAYVESHPEIYDEQKKERRNLDGTPVPAPTHEEAEEYDTVLNMLYEKRYGSLKDGNYKISNENGFVYNKEETALLEYDFIKDMEEVDYKGII